MEYAKQVARSYEIYQQAQQYYWHGTLQSKRPESFVAGEYPLYFDHAKGAYIWDVDGNQYTDYIMGYGAISLGYCVDEIDDAAIAQIRKGVMTSLSNAVQMELARELTEVIPCAERVHLGKTGSDVTSAAVRLARIYTGRDKIVRWGYNGWHDWCSTHKAGIPEGVRENILTFTYNDLASLEEVFARYPGQIAAVLTMPLEVTEPAPGFLQAAKDLAHKHGALFILDEMRSGFRMAPGGAQEYYGVTPDLATFSKGMANGYPVSALVGRKEILDVMDESRFSSTFFTNAPDMAASLAVVRRIRRGDVVPYVWKLGTKLTNGLRQIIRDTGVEAEMVGVDIMPYITFGYDNAQWSTPTGRFTMPAMPRGSRLETAWRTFYTECTRGGVLFHPEHHWYVGNSHTEADIDRTLDVCGAALRKVKASI